MNDAWLIAAYVTGGMLIVFGVARVILTTLARRRPFTMLSRDAPSAAVAAAGIFGIALIGLTCVAWLNGRLRGAGWEWWAFLAVWFAPVLAEVPRARRYLRDPALRRGRVTALLGASFIVVMTCVLLGLGVATMPFLLTILWRHGG